MRVAIVGVDAIGGFIGASLASDKQCEVSEFCSSATREAAAFGQRLGCAIQQCRQDRHAVTAKLSAYNTSMLQDAKAGRAIEHDSIVTNVHEMELRLSPRTPKIDALLGMTRLFVRTHKLYPRGSTLTPNLTKIKPALH